MWILYLLLYLIGVYVTIFLLSSYEFDFDNVSVLISLIWPILIIFFIVFFIPVILGCIAYDMGQWYKYEKDTMNLVEYLKTKGTFSE